MQVLFCGQSNFSKKAPDFRKLLEFYVCCESLNLLHPGIELEKARISRRVKLSQFEARYVPFSWKLGVFSLKIFTPKIQVQANIFYRQGRKAVLRRISSTRAELQAFQ